MQTSVPRLLTKPRHLGSTKQPEHSIILHTASTPVFNTFYTLITCGCLCVPSDADRKGDISASIRAMNANLLQLTPSLARLITPQSVPNVDTLILTGEKLSKLIFRRGLVESKSSTHTDLQNAPLYALPTLTLLVLPMRTILGLGLAVSCGFVTRSIAPGWPQ